MGVTRAGPFRGRDVQIEQGSDFVFVHTGVSRALVARTVTVCENPRIDVLYDVEGDPVAVEVYRGGADVPAVEEYQLAPKLDHRYHRQDG